MYGTEERVKMIADIYADEPKIEVKPYDDLTIDLARREGRSSSSKGEKRERLRIQREQADINRQIGGVDTILFYAEPQLSNVSSSLVGN